nr:hypothetical protein [uncultured Chryseobacterium sp.]
MENFSLLSLIALIVPALMLLVSIYYAAKRMDTEAVLLITGSGITFVTSLAYSFMPYYLQSRSMPFAEMSVYYAVLGGISFIGSIIFIIGFFMLILKFLKISGNPDKKSVL